MYSVRSQAEPGFLPVSQLDALASRPPRPPAGRPRVHLPRACSVVLPEPRLVLVATRLPRRVSGGPTALG
eukprot:13855063-Heterocapsa_arctica.AAC.1